MGRYMKPKNPYRPIEVCEVFCHRYKPNLPKPSCIRSGFCEAYNQAVCFQNAWDEGYNDCTNQPISEQEGWQTGEPSKEEGPFLLDLGDNQYKLADSYISATPNRESAFRNTSRILFPYTFLKYVKRWKLI